MTHIRHTARIAALVVAAMLAAANLTPGPAIAAPCADPAHALGVSRIIEIDTSTGPMFGDITKRAKEDSFLAPKEVVLTFDDGPIPRITAPILDALDKFCTKATFFSVGEMALEYPATVKDVLARGHTLGTHTWTHPLNLNRLSVEKATAQIERGLAAVSLAAETPVAPFFRFPGLSDSDALLDHLQKRGIASFTVDVVSNDSYIASSANLAARVIRLAEAHQGGILLFHDIKAATAKALPTILAELQSRGFKVVHLRAKATATPLKDYDDELKAVLAKATAANKTVASHPESPAMATADGAVPPVTILAPAGRDRAVAVAAKADTSNKAADTSKANASKKSGGPDVAAPVGNNALAQTVSHKSAAKRRPSAPAADDTIEQ
ncbi:MAG: polysaccharide deacetylase family protein [Hyphomicrobium sp.]|jgi:peptidoglycan/xylan/chitin deacetylase (PgdA/CDA1 family)